MFQAASLGVGFGGGGRGGQVDRQEGQGDPGVVVVAWVRGAAAGQQEVPTVWLCLENGAGSGRGQTGCEGGGNEDSGRLQGSCEHLAGWSCRGPERGDCGERMRGLWTCGVGGACETQRGAVSWREGAKWSLGERLDWRQRLFKLSRCLSRLKSECIQPGTSYWGEGVGEAEWGMLSGGPGQVLKGPLSWEIRTEK